MKIPVGIEKVLYLAAVDKAFREALFADRSEALSRPGVNLLPDEAAVLKCIPDDRLQAMIAQIDPAAHGRRFMQKVAACAVALAATTAGASDSRGGNRRVSETPKVGSSVVSARPAIDSSQQPRPPSQAADLDNSIDVQLHEARAVGTMGIMARQPKPEDGTTVTCSDSGKKMKGVGSQGVVTLDPPFIVEFVEAMRVITILKSKIPSFCDCYTRELKRSLELEGAIKLHLEVGIDGAVTNSTTVNDTLGNSEIAECVLAGLKKAKFPQPTKRGGRITVPLRFSRGKDAETEKAVAVDPSDPGGATVLGTSGDGPQREPRIEGKISLGACSVVGSIEPDKITGVVRSRIRSVLDCYEKELTRSPNLEGEIKIGFVVDESGKIKKAEATSDSLGSPPVADCILSRMRHWRFPKPESGTVTATVPFRFWRRHSADAGTQVEVDPSDLGGATVLGARGDGSAGTGGASVAVVKLGVPDVEGYTDPAEVTKTMEARVGRVKDCYENEMKEYGTFEGYVELRFTIGNDGRVSEARVSEETIGNAVVAKCALSELKRMRFPKPDLRSATVTICLGFSRGR
ncbi:MAG: AgmX/PglI C-terminal domain-containing protein [Deltaproteobacteria bacterium]|nr:AgmX/PglI C-terminal domain-containing protein [Deltaproteobacteria bacterium]